MTEENQHSLSGESRRSFMKKSAVASGGLALGVGGTGTVAAQDGDAAEGGKALMFNDAFRPGAQFRVVSPVIEQQPDVSGVNQGDIWSNYNTRAIQFLNTNEQVLLFPAHDAEVKQGQVYELQKNFSLFADDTNDQGIISVSFEPVGEDEVFDDEFDVLDDGGGKALVKRDVFRPNALFRVTSGVVKWTPNDNVQGTDLFSDYNTRFAEYLNAGNQFMFYPAQAAELKQGAIYVMSDEFDVTDPEGNLMTVDFDRVDEATLNDGLLDGNGGNGGNQSGGNQSGGNSSN